VKLAAALAGLALLFAAASAAAQSTDRYRPNYGSKLGLPIFLTRG